MEIKKTEEEEEDEEQTAMTYLSPRLCADRTRVTDRVRVNRTRRICRRLNNGRREAVCAGGRGPVSEESRTSRTRRTSSCARTTYV